MRSRRAFVYASGGLVVEAGSGRFILARGNREINGKFTGGGKKLHPNISGRHGANDTKWVFRIQGRKDSAAVLRGPR
ncbi:hypothetical protein HMPREF1257_01405 [Corynebacterium sp. KPL1814]|nr:hypothetical protein HMPREF1257_01405 [Corynebacterium sp. KPL1814]ERS78799.1 hypothetical protein HMPREF1285_01295 [Corynebacterium sp. KPL1859]